MKFTGDSGIQGPPGLNGQSLFTWVKFADDIYGNGMSDDPYGKKYIGLAFNQEDPDEEEDASKYTWSRYVGETGPIGPQGIPGVPGEKGESGKTTYTWIRYAEDEFGKGIVNVPNERTEYIGIAHNQDDIVESDDPSLYTWTKIKGNQGIPGEKGDKGDIKYTHIKFADDIYGNGMSDDSEGKEYLGIAYDMDEPEESENASDYKWVKIKGDKGVPGPTGSDGKSLYTWIKFADDINGNGMSDSPEGKTYMGLAYNQKEEDEEEDASKYIWVRIKGENGADGRPGADGEDGKDGADGDIESFPDTLPDTPIVDIEALFTTIGLTWTYENKLYYNYEVYASQTKDFIPNEYDLIFRGQASAFLHQVQPSQTWYYRVRCVNSHGSATAFSKQVSASTFKLTEDNIENYIEDLAIGNALIGNLSADKINAGKLKAMYLDTKELTVTDGNESRTLYIDSYGRVYLNVTELQINSKDVATEESLNTKVNQAKNELNNKIDKEVTDMTNAMNNAIDELDRALSDSILTESEKASLREHLNIIEREMNDIVAQVAAIRKASELKNTAELAELNLRESEYLASYDGFVARLQQVISRITKGE